MKTLLLLLLFPLSISAQEPIKVMFYNIYRFPEKPPAHRENILKEIINTYRPDLFMVCELISENGADRILNTALQTPSGDFKRAVFVPTLSDFSDPLHQTVFYNRHKFTLVKQYTYPTTVRDINRYTFVLNALDLNADSVYLEVFVTHLKSSEGPANKQLRLGMIDTFVAALHQIPADRHVLLAGDFNFYNADDEPAYQKITDPANPIVMVDPIAAPGNWHDNEQFKDIHTQATRISAEGFGVGGATGGMDDRFDFIMMSENFRTDPTLYYVENSYKAYGNNGNCFNERIDAYHCDGVYSLELRQHLYNMSDHTPVIMQLQTNKQFLAVNNLQKQNILAFAGSNLTDDFITLNINEPGKISFLYLYNSLGQLCKKSRVPISDRQVKLYVSDLAAGFYYIKTDIPSAEALKFIKQ